MPWTLHLLTFFFKYHRVMGVVRLTKPGSRKNLERDESIVMYTLYLYDVSRVCTDYAQRPKFLFPG